MIFNFDNNKVPQHVMIYSENNNVIEAQYEGTFVKENSYWSWQGVAVRVIKVSSNNNNIITRPIEIYYRVICGSFKDKANAKARLATLKAYGFNSFIATYLDDGVILYRVVTGSYKERVNAEIQQKALNVKGFSSFIN